MLQVIGKYKPPPVEDFAVGESVKRGACDAPLVLKKLARDLLTALDYLHS
jgi:hypothetical protein